MLGLCSRLARCAIVSNVMSQQTRNTFILKRKFIPPLHKKYARAPKFRARHFIYDIVQDLNVVKQPELKVILTSFVEGLGNVGDVVQMRPNAAYKELLLPGLAVYANPKNLEKYKMDDTKPIVTAEYSSPYVLRTISCLSKLVLEISMNKSEPWTLEPWHVRTSFRKAGFIVPEHAIEMPPIKITGPDLSLQDKEFYVTVTINKKEKVNVRCRIHHWATGLEKLPWEEYHWTKPREPLIPEQAAVLQKIPLPTRPEDKQ